MSAVSLEEYKDFLGIPEGDKSKDNAILRLALKVEDFFSDYTGRLLTPTPIVKLLNGTGTNTLTVPFKPIVDVTMVQVLDTMGIVRSTYSGASLRFDLNSGIIKIVPTNEYILIAGIAENVPVLVFPKGTLNIRLTYTGGYAIVPEKIKLILVQMLAYFIDPFIKGAATERSLDTLTVKIDRTKIPVNLLWMLNSCKRVMIG